VPSASRSAGSAQGEGHLAACGGGPRGARWVEHVIDTARGPAALHLLSGGPSGRRFGALAVLLHGAGSGVTGGALERLGLLLADARVAVVGLEQPYRVAGRRAPDRAPVLDATVLAALPRIREVAGVGAPLLLAGRSSGARVACRVGGQAGAIAVAALAFPFAPPRGRPDRGAELLVAGRRHPVLVVQGDRDPFGRPPDYPGVVVQLVPGGHTPSAAAAEVAAGWLLGVLEAAGGGIPPGRRALGAGEGVRDH